MLTNKVEICGINTSRLPVLANPLMQELFRRMQAGDRSARESLISGNLRLVLSVIQRFSNRGENPDDLFQVGCVGLIKAVDHFDLGQNVRFSTYAVPMIIGEIRRYLRDNNPIRVSRSLRDIAYRSMQAREALTLRFSREPSISEIARELEMKEEEILFAMDAIQDPVSLFEPIYHDGGEPIYIVDHVRDEKNHDRRWTEEITVHQAIARLSEREQKIINLRFFEGKTQMEVAQEIHISKAQVSRLEKGALQHLRKFV